MVLSRARAVRVSMNHLPRPASHHFASISAYVPVCACAWFVCVDVCVRVDVRVCVCVLSHSELCHSIRLHPKSPNIELPAGPFDRGSPQESKHRTPGCAILSEVNSGVRRSHSQLCHSTGNHPRRPKIAIPAVPFDRISPRGSENHAPDCALRSEITPGVRTSRSLLCNSIGNHQSESRTPQLCRSVENHPRTPLVALPAMSFDRMSPQ